MSRNIDTPQNRKGQVAEKRKTSTADCIIDQLYSYTCLVYLGS